MSAFLLLFTTAKPLCNKPLCNRNDYYLKGVLEKTVIIFLSNSQIMVLENLAKMFYLLLLQ